MTTPRLLADRYAPGSVLGRGGMGVVYEAIDQLLDRRAAVKVLNVTDAPPEALERFRREARFLAGLAHANVVTIFDFGVDDQSAWIVMELLPGPTLAELVARDGPLPLDQVTRFGAQTASALAAAHAAGVVHRDVKPSNVMLADSETVKLLDLGIARLAGASDHGGTLTQTGTLLGSVPFIAPEVINGEQVTPAVDTYALGAVLFMLLTGRPPFQGESTVATMAQHVTADVPHPRDVRPDVPVALDALVTSMLAKNPTARPAMAAVERQLAAFPATVAMAEPTQMMTAPTSVLPSPTPSPDPRRRSLTDRHVLAAVVVVLILLVGAVVALSRHRSDHPSSAPTSRSTSPSASASPTPTASRSAHAHQTANTIPARLAALRAAVASAAASGALEPHDADDLTHRVDDIGNSLVQGKPGDISHKLQDFAKHLEDLSTAGHITSHAYSTIAAAAAALAALLPAEPD